MSADRMARGFADSIATAPGAKHDFSYDAEIIFKCDLERP